MSNVVLAAGVLGVAGWGIYRRSQAVASLADQLPMPEDLELISRAFVVTTVGGTGSPINELLQSDLTDFFSQTGWGTGATVVPDQYADFQCSIGGVEWPYQRLILANSLNLMCVINDAQARVSSPPIPDAKIGTAVSFFDLSTTRPQIDDDVPYVDPVDGAAVVIKDSIRKLEAYVKSKIPQPTTTPTA